MNIGAKQLPCEVSLSFHNDEPQEDLMPQIL
jgi:hypothetical protein